MPAIEEIVDGKGSTFGVKVTKLGQVVTAPISYDLTQFVLVEDDNVAQNIYTPLSGKQFVVTGITIKATQDVSTTVDAEIVIYQADSADTTTVYSTIHQEALVRNESATLVPLNILTEEGKYINAKTTDATVYITVTGYYIDKLTDAN